MNTYGRGPVPWEGTISRVRKNGYVPLGTYQNINLENFGGGPVQYFKKIPYSNFLGRTSQKRHPICVLYVMCIICYVYNVYFWFEINILKCMHKLNKGILSKNELRTFSVKM